MTGQDIKKLLDTCISGDTLHLGQDNPLGQPQINTWLQNWFNGALTATVPAPTVGTDRVVYSATLDSRGFLLAGNNSALAVTLTFSGGANNTLDASLAMAMPDTSTLNDIFPILATLDNNPMGRLSLTRVTFTLASTDGTLTAGFAATVATGSGLLQNLAWLLGDGWSIAGQIPITTTGTTLYPRFSLQSPSLTTPSVSGFQLSAKLTIQTGLLNDPETSSQPILSIQITLNTALVTPGLTLPVMFVLQQADQTTFMVGLDTSQPLPAIDGLAAVAGFTGSQTPTLSADTPLGTLSLADASLLFDASSRTFSQLQLKIALGTDWTIINNLLLLQQLTASLAIPTLNSTSFSTTVAADMRLADARITATIRYPEKTVALDLDPATALDINQFMGCFAKGATLPGNSTLSITQLSALADIPNSSYTLSCQAEGQLNILPKFHIDSLELAVDYRSSALDSFQFGAVFTIAGAQLYLSALWSATTWTLSGGTWQNQNIDLTNLVGELLNIFDVALPATLPHFILTNLELANYTTHNNAFAFTAAVNSVIDDDPILKKITGNLDITYSGTPDKSWSGTIQGTIQLGENLLTVAYDFKKAKVLTLSWEITAAGHPVGLVDLCQWLAIPPPPIPADLDLGLKKLAASYDLTNHCLVMTADSANYGQAALVALKKNNTWGLFFGVAVKQTLNLGNLPLIDDVLGPDDTVAIQDIHFAIATLTLDEKADQATIAAINSQIQAQGTGYPTIPEKGIAPGVNLSMVFAAGSYTTPLELSMNTASQGAMTTLPLLADAASGGGTVANATGSDGTVWYTLQKTFGPVSFQKVGIRYKESVLYVLMNAALGAGGLTISVAGLGMGSPLTTFSPEFTIDGIAIDFASGPVSISGGLQGTLAPINFNGELSLRISQYSIGALGGYTQIQGQPSFFLYAMMGAPLGGPPCFFVTGLAAGFGYNRTLVIPDISGVADFPLVQWAMGTNNPPGMDPGGDIGKQVTQVLDTLTQTGVVAPSLGDYWLALGIRFTSYELLHSFALLTMSFGTRFEVDLLGLSTLAIPASEPVAMAELALKVSFSPDDGLMAIQGQLTPRSYILSKDCHLTGGFAFYLWFSGPHQGEFLVTLGGFGPRYQPPSYYPLVPSLGINWQVDANLTIKGDLYYALTSKAVMAGGGMSAVWSSGPIKAWFSVQADFLMVFTPFHYYMGASVQLGASCRINLLFTHITISIHLGVGLEIWGPEFSGRARVDLSIVSFTISFGGSGKNTQTTVSWNDFVQQLLPKPQSTSQAMRTTRRRGAARRILRAPRPPATAGTARAAVVQISIVSGLLKTLSDQEGQLNFVVSGENFVAATSTVIPAKEATFTGIVALAPEEQQPSRNGQAITPASDFGVGPTGTAGNVFQSTHAIQVISNESSQFLAVRTLSNVPKSLWEQKSFDSHGVPQNVDPLNDVTVGDALTGFTLTPSVAPPDQTLPILLQNLQYTIDPDIRPLVWSNPSYPTTDSFANETVATTIASTMAAQNRAQLLAAMRQASLLVPDPVDIRELANPSATTLLAEPILRLLGEQRGTGV